MARVEEKVADGSVLELIRSFLEARIMDGLESWTPAAGAPPGAVLSPLLSNISLDPLDHLMAERGFQMVRYADDFVILCRTLEDAHQALDLVRDRVTENGLTRHPTKTQIVDSREAGFGFLACLCLADREFPGTRRTPRAKSLRKLKDTLREKTRRTSGDSLSFVVHHIDPSLRGWFACSAPGGQLNRGSTSTLRGFSSVSTNGFACDCGAFCENVRAAAAAAVARIITAGRIGSLSGQGCSF